MITDYVKSRFHKAELTRVWEHGGFPMLILAPIILGAYMVALFWFAPLVSPNEGRHAPVYLLAVGAGLMLLGLATVTYSMVMTCLSVHRSHDPLRAAGTPRRFVSGIINSGLETLIVGPFNDDDWYGHDISYHQVVDIDYLASYRMQAKISAATKGIKDGDLAQSVAVALLLGFSEDDVTLYDSRRLVELHQAGFKHEVIIISMRADIDLELAQSFFDGQSLGLRIVTDQKPLTVV
jgi:hypothetical protein